MAKIVTVAVTLVLGGCGTSSTPTVTNSSQPSATVGGEMTPSHTPPSPEMQSLPMTHTWSYAYTTREGYKFGGQLEAGSAYRVMPGLIVDGLTAGSICAIDTLTEAVIPGRFTVTNYTKNFPAKLAESLSLKGAAMAEVGYSSGQRCFDGNSTGVITLASDGTLTERQSIQVPIFFVLRHYYTPTHPDGDPAVLKDATVYIGTSGTYAVEATGPGLVMAGTSMRIVPLGG